MEPQNSLLDSLRLTLRATEAQITYSNPISVSIFLILSSRLLLDPQVPSFLRDFQVNLCTHFHDQISNPFDLVTLITFGKYIFQNTEVSQFALPQCSVPLSQ